MSEIEQAEVKVRRGIGYALLAACGFIACVVMTVVAIGQTP